MWVALNSGTLSPLDLTDIAENFYKDRIQNVEGVGRVMIGGAQRFSVRVRLDSMKLASHQITVGEQRRGQRHGGRRDARAVECGVHEGVGVVGPQHRFHLDLQRPVAFANIRSPEFRELHDLPVDDTLVSLLATPMIFEGEVIGVL